MATCPKCHREEHAFGEWKCGYCAVREIGQAWHRGGIPEVERLAEQKRTEDRGAGGGCLLALFTTGGVVMAAMEMMQHLS